MVDCTRLGFGGAWTVLLVAGMLACGGTRTTYDGLYVEVSAAQGISLDQVRFWVLKGDGAAREVTPRDPDQVPLYTFDVSRRDLHADPFLAKLVPGTRFQGEVTVVVVGYQGTKPAARAQVGADLADQAVARALLVALPADCDADGDGFPDCSKTGCCAPGETLGDCNDADRRATPVGFEDDCTRCGFLDAQGVLQGDTSDDDCSGAPAVCQDADQDGSRDCAPTWCKDESKGSPNCESAARDVDCDTGNARVYPGATEACDGLDNDCNGQTDENPATTTVIDWDGQSRKLGDTCGTGRCAGGKVECGTDGRARCSTDDQKEAQEDCSKRDDANCNGEPADGCTGGDLDGDGVPDLMEIEGCPANPLAKFHAEVFPELGAGFPKHPFPEPCCDLAKHPGEGDVPPSCDWNCDGKVTVCAAADADGDGFPEGPGTDCNDGDSHVHAGAVEKCGDNVDQDCSGSDLPCAAGTDKDGDGFLKEQGDCDDGDAAVNPWAPERCNGKDDNCNGLTDEGNPEGADEDCGTDEGECVKGTSACIRDGTGAKVQCVDQVTPVEETCDGRDNDCNGLTDEAFRYDEATGKACHAATGPVRAGAEIPAQCAGMPRVGEACRGLGECGNFPGVVLCKDATTAACSTNPDSPDLPANKATKEICNNKDDDCDGLVDDDVTSVEESTCIKIGVCLAGVSSILARCSQGVWSCDYSQVPGYEADVEKTCDRLDNNCDGQTDEAFTYSDKVHPDPVPWGAGCGTGACANGKVVCKADGTELYCDTSAQQQSEVCDYLDDDCNGSTDETFTYLGIPVWIDPKDTAKGRSACPGIGECPVGVVECKSLTEAQCSTNPGGSQYVLHPEACDARDNDCNGQTDETFTMLDWNGQVRHKGDSCGTGLCVGGQAVCRADQAGIECSTANLSRLEVCDNLDDDCNGQTDEGQGWVPPGGAAIPVWVDPADVKKGHNACTGIGECGRVAGIVECNLTTFKAVCSTNPDGSNRQDRAEICNYLDDDCNGQTDEDQAWRGIPVWVNPADVTKGHNACVGIGECGRTPGVVECNPITGTATCSTNADGSQHQDQPETCNGKDDNCNGQTDEDQAWKGIGVWKDPADVTKGHNLCTGFGECANSPGFVECNATSKVAQCSTNPGGSQNLARDEVCDGKDNDCDEVVDDGLGITSKDTTCLKVGVCDPAKVVAKCIEATWVCDYTKLTKYEPALERSCDGLDNDCDGSTDEDFAMSDWNGASKKKGEGCGTGACASGLAVCRTDGTGLQCSTAGKASAEVCDGLDNDCNGLTDEGFTFQDWNGTIRQKGDSCGTGLCLGGSVRCKADGTGLECSTGFAAKAEACNGKDDNCNGATDEDTDALCHESPDILCTKDTCTGGACKNVIVAGFCLIGGQCYSDGAANPAQQCQYCNSAKATTAWTARSDGTSCDFDSSGCTVGDSCLAGICKAGPAKDCSALNGPCRQGTCRSTGPTSATCEGTAIKEGQGCDDGNACTSSDRCASGTCVGTAYSCDDSLACTTDLCNGTGGCTHPVNDGVCLIAGVCRAAGTQNLENPCQECVPTTSKTAWTSRPDNDPCSDGNPCTTSDVCQKGTCTGAPLNCNDGNGCTTDTCNAQAPDEAHACVHTATPGVACADGNPCTFNDLCQSDATCKGTRHDCVAPAACVTSTCNGIGGCTETVNAGQCYIGGLCYATGGTAPGNVCKTCDPSASPTDWTNAVGTPCSDNNVCTVGDRCSGGACVPTGARDCNDSNACTDDSCNIALGDPATGCMHVNNTLSCNDNSLCTINDLCSGGVCSGTPKCTSILAPDCAPASGTCGCGSGVSCPTAVSDRCVSGTCVCGATVAACDPASMAPDCVSGTCTCKGVVCDPAKANVCSPTAGCVCGSTGAVCNAGLTCCPATGTCESSC